MCIRDSVASTVRFLARGWVGSLYLAPEHHLTYPGFDWVAPVSYTHLRAHETVLDLVCRLLLEKKKKLHTQYLIPIRNRKDNKNTLSSIKKQSALLVI